MNEARQERKLEAGRKARERQRTGVGNGPQSIPLNMNNYRRDRRGAIHRILSRDSYRSLQKEVHGGPND